MVALFKLIHSLTKTEKRYFKLQFGKQKLKYLVLFDAIDTISVFDKALIKKVLLTDKDFEFKNLAVDVNYLYENVLQSQQLFHKNKNANFKIKNRLAHIEILYNKGHLDESLNLIKKTKKLIMKYEYFTYVHELSRWEQTILVNQSSIAKVLLAVTVNKVLYSKLDELDLLNNYYLEANSFRSNWPKSESNFKELLLKIPFKDYANCKSISAKIKYLQIQQLYSFLKLDKQKEYKILMLIISLIKNEFIVFLEEYPMKYLKIYSRKLYLDLSLFPKNILETSIFFLDFPKKQSRYNERIISFSQVYMINFVLSYYIKNEAYQNGAIFIGKINFNIEKYINKVNQSFLLGTYYKMCYVYFRNDNFDKSIDYLNLIIQGNSFSEKDDIYLFSQIFSLIVHYEKGNYIFVENRMLVIRKLLKKTVIFKGAFEIFFVILKDFIAYKDRIDNGLLDDILLSLINDKDENDVKLIEKYFDIKTWINSKRDNLTLKDNFDPNLVRFDLLFK
ncbi:MAG: hypothetical protein ACI8ZX_001231 [Planctomycetota bacterium]|jgi:hypothetical protein